MSDLILPELTDIMCNGLIEQTEAERVEHEEWMHSVSVPFTLHWQDLDDNVKILQWDSNWESFLSQRAALVEKEGRQRHLMWNLYRSLQLNWSFGYAFSQGNIGTCAMFGHLNSGHMSVLSNAFRLNRTVVQETNPSIAYALARGNGTARWGSGANLNPMLRWAAQVGNHLVADVGRYDTAGSALRHRNTATNAKALQHQSIGIPLRSPSFEDCYAVCAAGFGINMGTHTFPTSAILNRDGLAVPHQWRNGGHAMSIIGAWETPVDQYLYILNSHGARYVGDSLHTGMQHGFYANRTTFARMASNNPFRYGNWYAHLMEMGR